MSGSRAEDLGLTREALVYEEFFEAAWPRLYRTVLAIAGDGATAEDALQAAFAKAYSSWSRVSAAEHPEAYVRRMAVNEVLSWRRSARWRKERVYAEVEERGSVASPEGGVVDRVTLWEAVQALPVRQRAVVVLRYYEDLSEAEIAAAMGCSRGTVKSQASAALATLRRTTGIALGEGDQ